MKPKPQPDLLESNPVQDAEPNKTPSPSARPGGSRPNRGRTSPDRGHVEEESIQRTRKIVTNAKGEVTRIESKNEVVVAMTPMQLMRKAVEAGNLDLVERLITLQERMEASAARKAFADAMCAAQAEMKRVSRDASNPQTRSRYASFEALDRALRPIYSRHGFSLSFDTETGAPEDCIRVVCFVSAHGYERKYHLPMPVVTKGPRGADLMTPTHATMTAVAYARRGLLKMIFNVAEGSDVDDDGNAAGGKVEERINAEQAEALKTAIADCHETAARFCRLWRIKTVEDLPARQYDEAMKVCADVKARNAEEKAKQQ